MSARKRRVLFVSAIRSEYDILYAVMRAVDAHPALAAELIVTGAHLSPRFGSTVEEIERDGFRIVARLESLVDADTRAARVRGAGLQLAGLADLCERLRPDFLFAPMDREEAITVALAGSYLRIPVLHLGGGENSEDGIVDNAIRHATSRLAHVHFATTAASGARLVRAGEEPWRVHVVGAPGLDRLRQVPPMPDGELARRLGFDALPPRFVVVIQHPFISEIDAAADQMRATLDAVVALGLPALVSHPNSDAGGRAMVDVIEAYAARYPATLRARANLPRDVFVNAMRRAAALVGNSSCGLAEAPLYGLPAVNVGRRQRGREHAANVRFVPHDPGEIRTALERAVFDGAYRAEVAACESPYGDGRAGERIAEIVAGLEIDDRLMTKRMLA